MNARDAVLRTLFLLGVLAMVPSTAHGQAWIEDAGDGYVRLGFSRIVADSFFQPDGSTSDIRRYTQWSLTGYGQVGIVDRWLMLTASGELYRSNRLEQLGRTYGLGDLELGAFTGLLQGQHNLSFGVLLGIPTGDPSPEADRPADEGTARSLPTGDGEWDGTLLLTYGTSFPTGEGYPLNHYVSASAGLWLRGKPDLRDENSMSRAEPISHAFRYRVEFGTRVTDVKVLDHFLLILRLSGVERKRPDDAANASFSGLGEGVVYHAPGIELVADIDAGLSLYFGVDGAIAARNVAAGARVFGGAAFDW